MFAWLAQLEWEKLFIMLLSAVGCLLCIVVHEVCHGLAAYWMGDSTAKKAGRLSLNPFKHIDIVGLIMLFTLRFGWAKPVPVHTGRFRNPRLGMAVTSLAGPVGNLLLTVLACTLYSVVHVYSSGGRAGYYLLMFLAYVMLMSTGLAVFNLLPIPPLDGSKVLFSFLPQRVYGKIMAYEKYGMILLVALLVFGVLDVPLTVMRNGVLDGILSVVDPVVNGLLTG